jgi:hypothetical protein
VVVVVDWVAARFWRWHSKLLIWLLIMVLLLVL